MDKSKLLLNAPNIIQDQKILFALGLAIKVLPDGKRALSSGLDFHLRLWDLETGTCIKSWDANGPLFSIEVDSNGTIAFLGAVMGIARWDIENWEPYKPGSLRTFRAINVIAYTESAGVLIGAGEDTTIYHWHLPTGKMRGQLPGHQVTIYSIDIDQSGSISLSGDLYGFLQLWDLETNTLLREWKGHEGEVSSIDMSSDGRLALTGSADGNVILWDLQNEKKILKLKDERVTGVILSKDAHWALCCGSSGLSLWDLDEEKQVVKNKEDGIIAMSMTPDESVLVGLVKNNHIKVWENMGN